MNVLIMLINRRVEEIGGTSFSVHHPRSVLVSR